MSQSMELNAYIQDNPRHPSSSVSNTATSPLEHPTVDDDKPEFAFEFISANTNPSTDSSTNPGRVEILTSSSSPNNSNGNNQPKSHHSNIGKRVLVIGIGNGGCRSIDYLNKMGCTHVKLLKIDMDADSLDDDIPSLQLSADGNGAGMEPENAILRVQEMQDEIHRELESGDVIFLLASLGGGTGSGALPAIAALAKNMHKHIITIVNTPETRYGQQREVDKSKQAIDRINSEDLTSALMIIPNDRLMELGDDMDEDSAYQVSYEIMAKAVKSLEILTNKQTTRKIDYNDLGTILQYRGMAIFATEHIKPEDGSESNTLSSIQQAFANFAENSLADIGHLKSAKGLLVNVCLAHSIKLAQRRWISERIGELCPDGETKWNSTVNPDFAENEVMLTVIATAIECDDRHQELSEDDFGDQSAHYDNTSFVQNESVANPKIIHPNTQPPTQPSEQNLAPPASSPRRPAQPIDLKKRQQQLDLYGVRDIPAILKKARN